MNCLYRINRPSLSSAVQPQTHTMQSKQGSVPTPPEADGQAPVPVDALARRRLLLKGLGKGAGAAAVLVPIQTLAQTVPARLCTVSGIQSNVGSGRTGGTTNQCRGFSPSFYATLANWPNYNSAATPPTAGFVLDAVSYNQNAEFQTVFGSGSTAKLFDIVTTRAPASELIWVTALLNAFKLHGLIPAGQDGYFPYSPSEVVALYRDTAKRADAERLFTNYLQGMS